MLTRMRQKKAGGFTLLELLIVVIIVGILAAVALPRFAKMTRSSQAAEAKAIVDGILTAQWVNYQENAAFVGFADGTNPLPAALLTDVPANAFMHFTYGAVTAVGPPVTVTVTATGKTGDPAAGIKVDGLLRSDGSRVITTTL